MDQLPIKRDIQFVVGDDWATPVNLYIPTSGYNFFSYLRLSDGSAVDITVDNVDVINGGIVFGQTAATTSGIPSGTYSWTLGYISNNDFRQTYYDGLALVIAKV